MRRRWLNPAALCLDTETRLLHDLIIAAMMERGVKDHAHGDYDNGVTVLVWQHTFDSIHHTVNLSSTHFWWEARVSEQNGVWSQPRIKFNGCALAFGEWLVTRTEAK